MAFIIADNISVELPIFEAQHRSLKKSILGAAGAGRINVSRGHVIVQALRDLSLTAKDGDRIALVGRNGAGKSTLLRTLAGLTEPNKGSVSSEGKIATLFNVGGFLDPNATGYENIHHAGRLLGLSVARIKELIPEIEEFTELGRYLSLPVRTYSAGMSVRLAFSIATSIEPDILLLDEAITAGDSHFVSKAARRAQELYERTSIMVIASHDTSILRQMCNRAIFLESGQIVASGDVESVLEAYERHGASALAVGEDDDGRKRVFVSTEGQSEGEPDAVLDGKSSSSWSIRGSDDPWIGIDVANPKTGTRPFISSVTLSHRIEGAQNAPELVVETSDDFFVSDIRQAGTIPSTQSNVKSVHLLQRGVNGRYWRVRPTADFCADFWSVSELAFNTQVTHTLTDQESKDNNPDSVLRDDLDAWISAKFTAHTGSEDRWIGYSYGANIKVSPSSMLIKQWDNGSDQNCVSRVRIDCSDDGFVNDVRVIAELELPTPLNVPQRLPLPINHRQLGACWRVVALTEPESGYWGVERLEFDTGSIESSSYAEDVSVFAA